MDGSNTLFRMIVGYLLLVTQQVIPPRLLGLIFTHNDTNLVLTIYKGCEDKTSQ